MNRNNPFVSRFTLITVLSMLLGMPLCAAGQKSHSGLSAGGYFHTEHSAFTDLPFGNGDVSYLLAYEYSERIALWQLALGFAPEVSGTRDSDSNEEGVEPVKTDFVLTPQLNLLFKDRFFRGGTGIMGSYVKDKDGDGDWIGPYWQLLLGLNLELGKSLSIGANAHYVMKSWDKIIDFKFGDIEYSALLSYRF